MIAAAYLPPDVLSQSQKLALMKIADSADDETRLARPGLTRLAAWVGVTDKRAITIVTELIAKGLVERVETGKAGRSAVYRVFPLGVPPTPTTPELKERLEARKAAPKNANKARSGVTRSAPAKPAMTYQDVEDREAARREKAESPQVEAGFHVGNPDGEAGFHGGNPDGQDIRVPPVEPGEFHGGNPLGSSGGTPSFPGSSSVLPFPPTPTADAAGEPASTPPDDSAPERGSRLGAARSTGGVPLPPAVGAAPTRAQDAGGSRRRPRTRSTGSTGASGMSGARTPPGAANGPRRTRKRSKRRAELRARPYGHGRATASEKLRHPKENFTRNMDIPSNAYRIEPERGGGAPS